MNRGSLLAASVGSLALAVLLLGLWIAQGRLADDAFADACAGLIPGDSLENVYATLGPAGYRPGCGTRLPCQSMEAGGTTWALSCTPRDCTQLWVRDGLRCGVEFDGTTRHLLEVTMTRAPTDP